MSSPLAKNDNIMSMFVLFSRLFWPQFGFFSKMGGQTHANLTPTQSNRMFLINVSKVQQLSNNSSKKRGYFDQKVKTNLTADRYRRLSEEKTVVFFVWKNCDYLDCLLGTNVTTLMCG